MIRPQFVREPGFPQMSGAPVRPEIDDIWQAIESSQERFAAWAYLCRVDFEHAYAQLSKRERRASPLHGVPFGVKDNLDVSGSPTSCGSQLYDGDVRRFDAACVALLRRAGAVPAGKTATTEFAFKHHSSTLNPWNTTHTPGGSSSGSAAAVACGAVPFALGTQTGGSITRPAAYCGVLGFKPSFGAVNRSGLRLLSDTMDTVGWFARTADEICAVADVLLPSFQPDWPPAGGRRPPRIVAIKAGAVGSLDPSGERVFALAVERLRDAGIRVDDLDVDPILAQLKHKHWVIISYEMARCLSAEYETGRSQLSDKLVVAIEAGMRIQHGDYLDARRRVGQDAAALLTAMEGADFILTPTASGAAPRGLTDTGESTFNRVWSVLGWPALHLPTMFDAEGLPLGVQLVGRPDADAVLLHEAGGLHQLMDLREGVTVAPVAAP